MKHLKEILISEVVQTIANSQSGLTYNLFKATSSNLVLREIAEELSKKIPDDVTVLVAPGLGASGLAAAVAYAIPRPMLILTVRDPAKSRPGEKLIEGQLPVEHSKAVFIDDTITSGATYQKAVDALAVYAPSVVITCCAVILDAWHPHGSRRIHASGIPVFSAMRRHDINVTRDCRSSAAGGRRTPIFTKKLAQFRVAELNREKHKTNPLLLADRVITADDSHTVRANAFNGTELWSWKPDGIRISKGIVQNLALQPDGSMLIAGYGGMVMRLTTDGEELWRTEVTHAIHSTPVVDTDGTIYVACEEFTRGESNQPGGSLVSLTSGGEMLQKFRYSEEFAPTRCTVLEKSVIVLANDKIMRCLNKKDFSVENWALMLPGLSRGEVLHHEGVLYLATESGHVMAVEASTGLVLWSKRVSAKFFGSIPFMYKDMIVVCDTKMYAHAVDMKTGVRVWISRFRSPIRQRPTRMSESKWFFAGIDGDVSLVDANDGVKLAQNRTGRLILQPGDYHDGRYAILTGNGTVQIWEVNSELRG